MTDAGGTDWREELKADGKGRSTVVTRTLCRPTLALAVASARREGFPVIVVTDGIPLRPRNGIPASRQRAIASLFAVPGVSVFATGRHFGDRGTMAFTVGAMMATTEFVTMLDDDDEFVEGAGDIIRDRLARDPAVDIWIPGLRYKDGHTACLRPNALVEGNVSTPTLRTTVLAACPWHGYAVRPDLSDLHHLRECARKGFTIRWIEEVCYSMRPGLPGDRGFHNETHPTELEKGLQ